MRVVVDTSVWSLALRRREYMPSVQTLRLEKLIQDGRTVLLGVVRQELLSGIRHRQQFVKLRDLLRAFPDPELLQADYETAADFSNLCRNDGIEGSLIDFLICAYASRRGFAIFTVDEDFAHYAKHVESTLIK